MHRPPNKGLHPTVAALGHSNVGVGMVRGHAAHHASATFELGEAAPAAEAQIVRWAEILAHCAMCRSYPNRPKLLASAVDMGTLGCVTMRSRNPTCQETNGATR